MVNIFAIKQLIKMKNFTYAIILVIGLVLNSCSSDDSPATTPPIDENPQVEALHINFKLNDQSFSFEPSTVTSLQRNIMGESFINDLYKRISLWTPVTPTVGSHPITDATPTDANIDTLYNVEVWVGDTRYAVNTGTIIITEVSATFIKGTFSGTGTDDNGQAFTITNGSFKAEK